MIYFLLSQLCLIGCAPADVTVNPHTLLTKRNWEANYGPHSLDKVKDGCSEAQRYCSAQAQSEQDETRPENSKQPISIF